MPFGVRSRRMLIGILIAVPTTAVAVVVALNFVPYESS